MADEKYRKVAQAIEDRFYEESSLSDKQDIIDHTGLPRTQVDSAISDMLGSGLVSVYEKGGSATIYLTDQMFNSLTAQAGEPDWIERYEFEGKEALREEIKDANKEISEFQKIERLLYGSGPPLEDSVLYCLEILEFSPESTDSDEDILIRVNDHVFVLEVKGVGGQINKSHVEQLGSWLDKHLDEGVEPENLTGVMLHNHQRHEDPSDRDYALTGSAERFLKHQRSLHISTKTLFDLVKGVKNDEFDIEEAQDQFLEGDEYAK